MEFRPEKRCSVKHSRRLKLRFDQMLVSTLTISGLYRHGETSYKPFSELRIEIHNVKKDKTYLSVLRSRWIKKKFQLIYNVLPSQRITS